MQDRYAGDIGDFSKLGLLRWLAVDGDAEPLPLGVMWWRVADEGHNTDGAHVRYLRADTRETARLCACDPELAGALAGVVASGRSVGALQAAGVLPASTRYFDEVLEFKGVPSTGRAAHREAWLERGLAAIGDAALVCVDPDNGLEIASCSLLANRGPKFIGYDELARVAAGRSVVAYQHVDRSGAIAGQIERRRGELRERVGGASREVMAVVFRRASVRVYFVIPQARDVDRLGRRVRELASGEWGRHFELG